MKPTWREGLEKPKYPKLSQSIKADVAVVGGGLTGITAAYLLAKAGKKVAVLESDTVGSGATEYTTAMISQELDTSLSDLVKMFGKKSAKLAWEAGGAAIDLIESIVKEEKIDCEFMRVPAYIYGNTEKEFAGIKEDGELARKLGFEVEVNPKPNLPFVNHGYVVLKNQAKFHPLKYLYALADRASNLGVQIYQESEATGLLENIVQTKDGQVQADQIIIATYYPFNNPSPTHYKKGMYVTYMFEVRLAPGSFEEALYWDSDNPYHYFRVDKQKDHDRMLIGGEDHRKELPLSEEKNYEALEEYLKKIVGDRKYEIAKKWRGPILEPTDGLALIGEYEPNRYVATAFSGTGMIYSGAAAIILSDLILGRENAWAKLFDPKRTPSVYQLLKKARDYTGELWGGAIENAV